MFDATGREAALCGFQGMIASSSARPVTALDLTHSLPADVNVSETRPTPLLPEHTEQPGSGWEVGGKGNPAFP